MALGIVSDAEFGDEVLGKIPDTVVIEELKSPGRNEGDKGVPDSIQKIIGDTAIESGRANALEMARFFGVSDSSTSAYANGATSTVSYNEPKKELKNHLIQTKARITRRAAKSIRQAFDNLTEDKLKEASAPELASVIRAFSSVIKDMDPTDSGPDNERVQFVMFAPPLKTEDAYDVIDIPR
jgi:hypothetical protein